MPATPGLMYEHGLDVLKGWFQPAALDFTAKLSDDVAFTVPAGRVVHVDEEGTFEMGCVAQQMAIFLISGETDFDVLNPTNTPSGNFMQQAIAPTGNMTGLVATGAYEIETTEFDATKSYAANDLLKASDAMTLNDSATGGVLTNNTVTAYTHAVCGVVSRGKNTNAHGIATLAFWPVYLPIA